MDRKLTAAQEESLRQDDERDLNEHLTPETRNIEGILNNTHVKLDSVCRLHGLFGVYATGEFAITEEQRRKEPETLAEKHIDKYKDNPHAWGYSDLFLSKTRGEFYADIDAAIIECGYSLEESQAIIGDYLLARDAHWKNRRDNAIKEKFEETKKKFTEMRIKVFVALRKKGYAQYDLSA